MTRGERSWDELWLWGCREAAPEVSPVSRSRHIRLVAPGCGCKFWCEEGRLRADLIGYSAMYRLPEHDQSLMMVLLDSQHERPRGQCSDFKFNFWTDPSFSM